MNTWLYVSVSTIGDGLADVELARIVDTSRSRNARLNVTGALVFTGARFAQCIEGPPASVAELRASIDRDDRHEAVTTLLDGPIADRQFKDWSLAYVGPSAYVNRMISRSVDEAADRSGPGGASLRRLLSELASQP